MAKKVLGVVVLALVVLIVVALLPTYPAFPPPEITPTLSEQLQPFDLGIQGAGEAEIHYTLDGSTPTLSSPKYQGPVRLAGRGLILVRAAAFGTRRPRSEISEMLYVAWTGLATQDRDPGLPETWGETKAHYKMLPDVVTPEQFEASSASNVIVDVRLAEADAFGPAGIFATREGQRPCRVIMALPSREFGSSPCRLGPLERPDQRPTDPKPSFELYVAETAMGTLGLPGAFTDNRGGFTLDAGRTTKITDPDPKQRYQVTYASTNVFDLTFTMLRRTAPAHTPGQLFINGLYWGLYDLHENADRHFLARRYGGSPEDYEVLGPDEVTKGAIAGLITQIGAPNASFSELDAAVDLGALADFYVLATFFNVRDFPRRGFVLARSKTAALPKLTIIPNGVEIRSSILSPASAPPEIVKGSVSDLFEAASRHTSFRFLVADRIQALFGPHGFVNRALAEQLFMGTYSAQGAGILLELARWGDLHTPGRPFPADRIISTVEAEARSVLVRADATRQFFASYALPLTAPTLQRELIGRDDIVPLVHANAAGKVLARLDGLDPRDPLTGKPREGSESAPLGPVARSYGVVTARVYDASTSSWSPLLRRPFLVDRPLPALRISEILFDPPPGQVPFVEIEVIAEYPLSLAEFRFGNAFFDPVEVHKGERFVVTPDRARFLATHPSVRALATAEAIPPSAQLEIRHGSGLLEASLGYASEPPWPALKPGHSLLPSTRPDDPASWRISAQPGGSPGARDPNEVFRAALPPEPEAPLPEPEAPLPEPSEVTQPPEDSATSSSAEGQ